MELDDDLCYEALRSRDARFDGRFFTAVVTTGIYCRPVCPARSPLRKNVRFFPTAAAAESEGFRPCLRCRPETSAGTPAWLGTSASVARALRLIDESNRDLDVDTLASRLGMTDRHLRRLFFEHVGASPIAVIQTRRAHLARRLLEESSLPMSDVAFGAGFASLRRFNDAIRKTYGCTPGEIRRGRRSSATDALSLSLALPFRAPLRASSMFAFFEKRAIPAVDIVDGTTWRRAVRFSDGDGVVDIAARDGKINLTIPTTAARDIHQIVNRARRALDLAADPDAIATHLSKDRKLRPIVKRFPGTRVPAAWDPFETAVRAIVGQQVSVAAATTIMGRIATKFGTPLESDPSFAVFPSADRLADAVLHDVGLPRARAAAINSIAAAVAEDPTLLERGAALDETVERLSALRGIGPWTAQYIAMRSIGEPDAFPHSDLGLKKAAEGLGIENLLEYAERWRPWRAYAAVFLWESLA